ncbi:hypothetical protein V6N11_065042 [Hibiscus sabdariffa]|uniref:Uncharacterized protein n=1 Tax=Hibiscus sabdariffa TaxID=183260 RepID=A0ABR2SJE6_9ROSI
MAAAGLDGFELMWVAGSMVILAFSRCGEGSFRNELWDMDCSGKVRAGSVGAIVGNAQLVGAGTGLAGNDGDARAEGIRGILAADKGDRELIVGLGNKVPSPARVVGATGAAFVPIVGVVPGVARKVKSVNSLVEALSSPEQQCVIAPTRTKRGRGRPAKDHGLADLTEEGGAVTPLTGSVMGGVSGAASF